MSGYPLAMRLSSSRRLERVTSVGARYGAAVGLLGASSTVAALFDRLEFRAENLVLVYLPAVALAGAWLGRGPAIFTALGAVVAYNFGFTEPRYTLRVHDPGHLVTFAVLLGIGLFVSDLTARLRQRSREAELHGARAREASLRAEGARLRAALTSSLSHDLRTPLAVITGAGTSLVEAGDALPDDARRELLATIVDESERLARIVDDLLHLTRLSADRPAVRREWHVVEELVGSALHRCAAALAERPVALEVPPDLPLIAVDGVLVELALINLLDNAAKHSPQETPVTVRAEVADGRLALTVADRGPGVRDADKERIFEPFFRASSATARGTGLGLTICRSVAEVHGGAVVVLDRPGGGATFRLVLPLSGEPPILAPERDLQEGSDDER